MKAPFVSTVALVATAFLVGCGKQQESAPAGTAGASSAPAAQSAAVPQSTPAAAPKAAEARVVTIRGGDNMKFDVNRIEAAPGEELKVVLVNTGAMPKEAMGHNWVLLARGVDGQAFATTAATAKATEYIPESLKDQVLAYTKLIGPKETAEVTFKAPTEPGEYIYLCSFPAHYIVGMKGVLVVK